jgi:ketosteroid isomerase-like protein
VEIEEIVRKALGLWNQGRLDEYLAFYNADVEYTMPGGVRGRGMKGLPEALKMQLTALPDSRIEIRQIVVQGDTAVVEGISTGTNTGPINLPGTDAAPPTGKRTMRGIALIMRLRDERIVEFREYSDRPTWLEQLGLVTATIAE